MEAGFERSPELRSQAEVQATLADTASSRGVVREGADHDAGRGIARREVPAARVTRGAPIEIVTHATLSNRRVDQKGLWVEALVRLLDAAANQEFRETGTADPVTFRDGHL